jgi:hypothetical protein
MPTQISGQVGPAQLSSGVSAVPFRQGILGDSIVSELHGRYFEQASRKNLFTCYSAARAITVVGTALVGLQIWNGSPVVGGINVVLLKTGGMITVTSATTTGIILATGVGQTAAPTGQTAADAVKNNFIGGQSPNATAIAAGTFVAAPTGFSTLMHNTAAIGTTGEDAGYYVDFEGSIILPPQTYCAICALGATGAAASWTGYLMWEEVPAIS